MIYDVDTTGAQSHMHKVCMLGHKRHLPFFLLALVLAACGPSAQGEEATISMCACGEVKRYGNTVHSSCMC